MARSYLKIFYQLASITLIIYLCFMHSSSLAITTTSKSSPSTNDNSNQKKLRAAYKDWKVLTTVLDNHKLCYTLSYPFERIGNHKDNRDPYVMVTYVSPKRQEISVITGYVYRKNSKVYLSIDGNQFVVYARGGIAWAIDSETDKKIIDAMKKGFKLMTRGESIIGTYSVDTYSLEGFPQAYTQTEKLCGSGHSS